MARLAFLFFISARASALLSGNIEIVDGIWHFLTRSTINWWSAVQSRNCLSENQENTVLKLGQGNETSLFVLLFLSRSTSIQ